jgi:serine/threonine-protein kinase
MSVWVRPRQAQDPEVVVFYFGERAAEDNSGEVLQGKFELIEPIAWGGMAAVYKARNRETKGLCAVKVLYPGAREHVASLFGQEGRLATRIRSPHLIRANAFGEDGGRQFIVFDYVQGEVLAGMYFMRLMPWRELLRVVLQVLDALAALHRRGIVHRDVKPDNVIVEKKLGDEIHVTLLDLGCASVPPERRLTGAPVPAREVYGTAGFIAPELLAGCPPEPRNDLYSVGALMYQKLTAQTVPDISPDPEQMVIPSPRAFVPSIPAGVDDVVMRALSDVEARFQSAEEMATALRQVIGAEDRTALREAIAAEDRAASSQEAELLAVAATSAARAELPAAASSGGAPAPLSAGVSTAAASVITASPEPVALSAAMSSAAVPAVTAAPPQAPYRRGASGRGRGVQGAAAALVVGAVLGAAGDSLLRAPIEFDRPSEVKRDEPAPSLLADKSDVPAPSPMPDVAKVEPVPASVSGLPTESSPVPSAPRKPSSAGKTRPVASFEKVMRELEGKARECARDAGVAEEPLEVQVLGEGAAISSVRVVDLGTRHPFTRCIDPAIRAAAPPLGDEPTRRYTFFARKR